MFTIHGLSANADGNLVLDAKPMGMVVVIKRVLSKFIKGGIIMKSSYRQVAVVKRCGSVRPKEEFLSGVTNDYVLAFIDSPRDKSVLSEHAKSANPALVKKYKIRGFPTALIFNGEGREVGKTGYRKGGPVEYVKYLKSIKEAPKAEK